MEPQIVQKPELLLVGVEGAFIHALSPDANNLQVIGQLWNQFNDRIASVPHRIGTACYGVIYSRPEHERSHRHELQYVAGVPVSQLTQLPTGMVSHTVPAHMFAVFTHRGPIDKIGETCESIYRHWLPQSEYEHADVADVEVYDERFDCEDEESENEYWISITPRNDVRPQ